MCRFAGSWSSIACLSPSTIHQKSSIDITPQCNPPRLLQIASQFLLAARRFVGRNVECQSEKKIKPNANCDVNLIELLFNNYRLCAPFWILFFGCRVISTGVCLNLNFFSLLTHTNRLASEFSFLFFGWTVKTSIFVSAHAALSGFPPPFHFACTTNYRKKKGKNSRKTHATTNRKKNRKKFSASGGEKHENLLLCREEFNFQVFFVFFFAKKSFFFQ